MKIKQHCYNFSSFCGFTPDLTCSAADPAGRLPSLTPLSSGAELHQAP